MVNEPMQLKVKLYQNASAEVKLDGYEIADSVVAVSINAGVGKLTTADITISGEIEFDGPVGVNIVDTKGRKIPLASYLQLQ